MSRDLKLLILSIRNKKTSLTMAAFSSQATSFLYSFLLLISIYGLVETSKIDPGKATGGFLFFLLIIIVVFFLRYKDFKSSIEFDQKISLEYLYNLRRDKVSNKRLKNIENELSVSITSQTSIITWTISTTLVVISLFIGFYSNFMQSSRNLISQLWVDKAIKSEEYANMTLDQLSNELSFDSNLSSFGDFNSLLILILTISALFYVTITLFLFKKKYLLSLVRNLISLDEKYPVKQVRRWISKKPSQDQGDIT